MTKRIYAVLVLATAACGCAHAKDAEVVDAVEPAATIRLSLVADTSRLQTPGAAADTGIQALGDILADHLAAVGQLRAPEISSTRWSMTVELPAPGWLLRAQIFPQAELLCRVLVEPLATAPKEHAVAAAPWSVQDALGQVERGLATLQPSKLPKMDAVRFARLRSQAEAARRMGADAPMTPEAYIHTGRPISSDALEAPYYAPRSEPSGLLGQPAANE